MCELSRGRGAQEYTSQSRELKQTRRALNCDAEPHGTDINQSREIEAAAASVMSSYISAVSSASRAELRAATHQKHARTMERLIGLSCARSPVHRTGGLAADPVAHQRANQPTGTARARWASGGSVGRAVRDSAPSLRVTSAGVQSRATPPGGRGGVACGQSAPRKCVLGAARLSLG